MLTKELSDLIEKSMLNTTNFYAKSGNMNAATAIHDAYLSLIKALKDETKTKGTTEGT